MIKAEEIKKCPYCGYNEFYRKVFISGKSKYRYNFGEPMGTIHPEYKDNPDNGELFDGLDFKENKTAYCENCNKIIK